MLIDILINKAHDAAAERDYTEAAKLYGMIMKDPTLNNRVDLKVRYAFCLEKTGEYIKSIKYYQEVLKSHKGSKNVVAIEALESKISLLRSLSIQAKKTNVKKKQSFTEQLDDASTRDFPGYLALGTTDFSSQMKDDKNQSLKQKLKNQDQSSLNYTSYLSLDTQDLSPKPEDDDETTLDLSKSSD